MYSMYNCSSRPPPVLMPVFDIRSPRSPWSSVSDYNSSIRDGVQTPNPFSPFSGVSSPPALHEMRGEILHHQSQVQNTG